MYFLKHIKNDEKIQKARNKSEILFKYFNTNTENKNKNYAFCKSNQALRVRCPNFGTLTPNCKMLLG